MSDVTIDEFTIVDKITLSFKNFYIYPITIVGSSDLLCVFVATLRMRFIKTLSIFALTFLYTKYTTISSKIIATIMTNM